MVGLIINSGSIRNLSTEDKYESYIFDIILNLDGGCIEGTDHIFFIENEKKEDPKDDDEKPKPLPDPEPSKPEEKPTRKPGFGFM